MRPHLLCACCITAIASCSSLAAAQPIDRSGRFALSGAVGISRSLDGSVTDVYGATFMPFTGQFDVRVMGDVALFGGFKWVRTSGQSVVVGTPVAGEHYPVSLRLMSYRFGAQLSKGMGSRWVIVAGGGISIAWYKETWPDATLDVSDRATGLIALAEGRYAITSRWSVIGRGEYATLPATTGGISANVGGLDGSAGLRFSF